MKTRFDNNTLWYRTDGNPIAIEKMSTGHLINTLAMFYARPGTVLQLLIEDIESGAHDSNVWVRERLAEDLFTSLHNVTSMSPQELTEYAMNSKLGYAMRSKLEQKGVCVKKAIEAVNFRSCEAN